MKKLFFILVLALASITMSGQIPSETDFYIGSTWSVDTAFDGVTIDTSIYHVYWKQLTFDRLEVRITSRVYVVEGTVGLYDTTYFKDKQTYTKDEFAVMHAFFYNLDTKDAIKPNMGERFKEVKPYRKRR